MLFKRCYLSYLRIFYVLVRQVDFVLLGFAINHGVYDRIFYLIHGLTVKINRLF